jgi:hypothetical protein
MWEVADLEEQCFLGCGINFAFDNADLAHVTDTVMDTRCRHGRLPPPQAREGQARGPHPPRSAGAPETLPRRAARPSPPLPGRGS